jgi:hypothetical protein
MSVKESKAKLGASEMVDVSTKTKFMTEVKLRTVPAPPSYD